MKNVQIRLIHFVLIIYLLLSIFLFSNVDGKMFKLIINPIFWLITLIYLYKEYDNNHGRFENITDKVKTVLIATLLYIIINFLSGLVFGYTRSPYSHSFIPFIKNMWQIVFVIFCLEYTRSIVLNENKKNFVFVIFFTLIFMMLEINYSSLFDSLSDRENAFKYISSIVLPLFFSNILFSYLTLKGSYKTVITYRLIVETVYLISPILPDLDWFLTGIRGIIVPVFIFLFIKFKTKRRRFRELKRNKKNTVLYIPFFAVILLFILFMAGVFKYEPIAILSNSMNPVFYKGDVVIYRKMDNKLLKKLDKYNIIVYSKEGQVVVHRIVKKYYKNGDLLFITKGDANITEDLDPVETYQIIGLYDFSLRYIGYPSVWLNRYFKYEDAKVEIK